jgi:hypothetical protein
MIASGSCDALRVCERFLAWKSFCDGEKRQSSSQRGFVKILTSKYSQKDAFITLDSRTRLAPRTKHVLVFVTYEGLSSMALVPDLDGAIYFPPLTCEFVPYRSYHYHMRCYDFKHSSTSFSPFVLTANLEWV